MKRIFPPVIFLVVVVLALGVVSYFVVRNVVNRPVPMTTEELVKLQEKGELGASEIPRVVACLDVDDEELRSQAAETLSKIGPKSVEALRQKLKSDNAQTRFWVVQSLALLGPAAADAAPDLYPLLKDGDGDVRRKTVYALGTFNVKSDLFLHGLINALSDSNEDVAQTAAEVLDKIDAPSKESVPMLAELAANGGAPAVRSVALKLLGRLGAAAVPALAEVLKTANPLDTMTIIQAIAPLGKQAKGLLPGLQAFMIKSRWWDADQDLVGIFKKCGPEGANGLSSVLQTLHDAKSPHFAPNDDRSKILVQALGEMGSEAKDAVPLLITLLEERETLRRELLQTLGDIGPAARAAIPAVETLTKDAGFAEVARATLRRMGKLD